MTKEVGENARKIMRNFYIFFIRKSEKTRCDKHTHEYVSLFLLGIKINFTLKIPVYLRGPLSPLLADISISDSVEKTIFYSLAVLFGHRHVDDILACFKGTPRPLNQCLTYINNQNIKFTLEVETSATIPSESLHPQIH